MSHIGVNVPLIFEPIFQSVNFNEKLVSNIPYREMYGKYIILYKVKLDFKCRNFIFNVLII